MGKISRISNELRDWITQTLNSGVNPEVIVDSLIKKGFDSRFSYTTLFRMVRNQEVQTKDYNQMPFFYEDPAISQHGSMIHTQDRDIKVLLSIDKPFILYLDQVISSDECDELIRLSVNRLTRSQVIDQQTGEVKVASGRTSEGTVYALNENPFISKIEKRLAELTNIPIENGEGLQVLHYNQGEEYKTHFDFFPESKIDSSNGGQRISTVLIYLNDVEEGGETTFPKLGLSIMPKKGAALYFHYGNSQGQVDRLSLHNSMPVITGDKWVATKWIRQGKITKRLSAF